MDNLNVLDVANTLGSFYFPRAESILSTLAGLTWRVGHGPTEHTSQEEPPIEMAPSQEEIPIDGYLGLYDPHTRKIVIYMKAVRAVAERLGCTPEHLRQIVLYHEWAHAILHLGFDEKGKQCELDVYLSIEDDVHECIAQLLTTRGIDVRAQHATDAKAREVWQTIQGVVFPALERHQSARYRLWHQMESLETAKLRRVLRAVRGARSLTQWDAFSLLA
jgi:hypothetical protein